MYEIQTRVGFSTTDENLRLPLTGIINLLQDCATFHTQDTGYTTQWLKENHRAWFVTDWQIRLHKPINMGDNVTVRTYPYNARGALASRYFTITDWDEAPFVTANSLWIYMDLEKMGPTRTPEEMFAAYGTSAPPIEKFGDRKIRFDGEMETISSIKVDETMIDSNSHVNNGKYISIAEHFLSKEGSFNFFRIEYKNQAHLGDLMLIRKGRENGNVYIDITDDENTAFMRLEAANEDRDNAGGDTAAHRV